LLKKRNHERGLESRKRNARRLLHVIQEQVDTCKKKTEGDKHKAEEQARKSRIAELTMRREIEAAERQKDYEEHCAEAEAPAEAERKRQASSSFGSVFVASTPRSEQEFISLQEQGQLAEAEAKSKTEVEAESVGCSLES
jgi:hypothetical protein